MPTTTVSMQEKIEELKKRRERLMQGGGPAKLEKHRAAGKLTARERIDALVDPGSFQETGLFATHRATLFGMAPPDAAPDGELRFRNPQHRDAKRPDLQPAIATTV